MSPPLADPGWEKEPWVLRSRFPTPHTLFLFFLGGAPTLRTPLCKHGAPKGGSVPRCAPPVHVLLGSHCLLVLEKGGGGTHGDGVPRLGEGAGGARSLLG